MFPSKVIGSILKRNKAHVNNISSHLKETASSRVISSSSLSASSSIAKTSFYGFRSLFKGNYTPSVRNMSMVASIGLEHKEGLKPWVTRSLSCTENGWDMTFWLSCMVVVLYGVAHLTQSALSMTDWKFTSGLPPMSDDQWL